MVLLAVPHLDDSKTVVIRKCIGFYLHVLTFHSKYGMRSSLLAPEGKVSNLLSDFIRSTHIRPRSLELVPGHDARSANYWIDSPILHVENSANSIAD